MKQHIFVRKGAPFSFCHQANRYILFLFGLSLYMIGPKDYSISLAVQSATRNSYLATGIKLYKLRIEGPVKIIDIPL